MDTSGSSHCAARISDLLEIQYRWFAFPDDCRKLALFGQQHHRSQHRGAQFHRAVICQGDEFFRVQGHCDMPMLMAGSQASTRTPDAQFQINQLWLKARYHPASSMASGCGRREGESRCIRTCLTIVVGEAGRSCLG